MRGHAGGVTHVLFAPDGRSAFSAGWDRTVRQWDLQTGKQRRWIYGLVNASIALSEDGRLLIIGAADGSVRLWDVERWEEVERFPGHTEAVYCVAISRDGKHGLSGGLDHTVRLWRLRKVTGDALTDQQRLQGKWRLISAEYQGKPVPVAELKDADWINFAGDTQTTNYKGRIWKGTFKLDDTAELKQLDFLSPEYGTVAAIYQVGGDKLTIAQGQPGEPRPASFNTTGESTFAGYQYRREAARPGQCRPASGPSSCWPATIGPSAPTPRWRRRPWSRKTATPSRFAATGRSSRRRSNSSVALCRFVPARASRRCSRSMRKVWRRMRRS